MSSGIRQDPLHILAQNDLAGGLCEQKGLEPLVAAGRVAQADRNHPVERFGLDVGIQKTALRYRDGSRTAGLERE